ncbi:unnamed protein product [Phytophthora fragariaefolia]|uniref:Unnamed protein product n=1 Tax=Phytophthora fragariaefolia TaxID=1490495 RepID=A0A9W6TU41_9STRA|nr:unnamed protein product [Phytophthora fragariaefolia]
MSHEAARLPNKKELGTWVPVDDDMQILAMSGELDARCVGDWIDELGDSKTSLDDKDEVQIGAEEPNVRLLVTKLLRVYRELTASTGDCPPAKALDIHHHIDTGDSAPIMLKRHRRERCMGFSSGAGTQERWGSAFLRRLPCAKQGDEEGCVPSFPRIDETLEAPGGALLFTTLDLRADYWQIRVAPDDRDKTAFTTKRGLYRFVRMPFGLTNAPSTFQRMLDGVLRELTWVTCLVYLDDIVVFIRGGIERYVVELANVFKRLAQAGLTPKLKKCMFAAASMEYVGHELSSDGV